MKKVSTKQDVALHLEAVREATSTLETAITITMDVIRKFDGKQFTRRITNLAQKAVDEALGQHVVSVDLDLNAYHFGVEFYLYKRAYQVKRKQCRGGMDIVDWVHFDDELQKSITCWDGDRYALDASKFQEKADQVLRANSRLVYKYADALAGYDDYQQAYLNAVADLQLACGAINPLFLEQMVYTTDTRISRVWDANADKAVGIQR